MSIKICLIIDDYLPNSKKVAAKMMHELACEFISLGHKVTVITPNSDMNTKMKISEIEGVKVCYFKSGAIKNTSKFKRLINETLLSFNAKRICLKYLQDRPHDLIIYYSPTIFFGTLVKTLKKTWSAKSYLILRDFFPQWAIDNKLIKPNSLISKYLQFFEKINYDNADIIGVMSPKNLQWFNNYYQQPKKVEVLYNWVNDRTTVSKTKDYKQLLALTDKLVFFYGGNIGHAQDMSNIVRLAINMQECPKVFFVLVGDGDEVKLVKKLIKSKNLTNMLILPAVSQSDYIQMLLSFDVGLFSLSKHHQTHNFPGKLLSYIQYGLPILGSVNKGNDLEQIINSYNAGLISVNGNDQSFFGNAKKLLDEKTRDKLKNNASFLQKKYFSVQCAVKQLLRNKLLAK